jgi:hypothetical protein
LLRGGERLLHVNLREAIACFVELAQRCITQRRLSDRPRCLLAQELLRAVQEIERRKLPLLQLALQLFARERTHLMKASRR